MKTTVPAHVAAPLEGAEPASPPRAFLRHLEVLCAAWAGRDRLRDPQRSADEAAFLPAALSLQVTPPHPAPRWLAGLLCAVFGAALLAAVLGRVDVVVVAPGRIVVSDGTKTVQPLEAGVVRRVHVRDGDEVRAGQLLVELDATEAQADRNGLQAQRDEAAAELRITQALLAALDAGRTPALPTAAAEQEDSRLQARWREIASRQAQLEAEQDRREAESQTVQRAIAKLEAMLPLVQRREADYASLAAQGFVSGHAGQDRQRERIEIERELALQHARLTEAQEAVRAAREAGAAALAATRRELSDRRDELLTRQALLGQQALKAEQRHALTRLTAPVDGTVQQLAVFTEGGVVSPAQPLMVIVPRGAALQAEVTVQNKDIGDLAVGQPARVKLEAFPFTRYGTVEATVSRVAADAVVDERLGAVFPATVALQAAGVGQRSPGLRLAPGMNVTVEIAAGRRPVIEYLLGGVIERVSTAFSER